jgi:putative flippase GtrA
VPRAHPSLFTRLWSRYGLKAVRYMGVSVVNVMVGQTLLVLFYGVLDWPGTAANIAAVVLSTVPAYLMMRHWVWNQRGAHRLGGEILPFWIMAAVGLVMSTIAVTWADSRWDSTIAIQLANISAFGLVWVSRFFILDHLMWADKGAVDEILETP